MLRTYDAGGKCLDEIKCMHANIEVCDSRLSRIPLASQRAYGCSNERSENWDMGSGSEIFGRGKNVEISLPIVCR